ncbi:F-box/LRR-repeat protein At5g63520 isoform X4 [Citrus sinensis]|uniref:F-box/LRR-repeat protein At5g63520 isoform X4 n=1 Tax=Citrus sinensis TaxID=2711 RepID=UPI002279AAEC|nr:F-box/LRR-repeat protein At5g63520 isoform X4 [Citrus sinensis]
MDTEKPSSSKKKKKTIEISSLADCEDVLHNILSRLPAKSFASAACVNKSWNCVCNSILSRPRIASACSFKASAPLVKHLGLRTPIILSVVHGVMGRDALTDEFREVKFQDHEDIGVNRGICTCGQQSGIVLTVGYLPGLKVDAIPLLRRKEIVQVPVDDTYVDVYLAPPVPMIDQFVMDIQNYTTSVSGCASPVGIIMFGKEDMDQKPIIEKLDYAMSMNTVFVGDERSRFAYRSGDDLRNVCGNPAFISDAVALVFASDKDKPHAGTGEIQFQLAMSEGVSAIGPRHKAVSVRANHAEGSTWLTAKREGHHEILDGEQILRHIDQLENRFPQVELYVGVTKRRKCSIGSEKSRLITTLAFHGIRGGDQEYLYVDGVGIKTGDYFQFYQPDHNAALAACRNASENIRNLKLNSSGKGFLGRRDVANSIDRKEVLGGFIFSCCGRGNSFFGGLNVDSFPFFENFPSAPLAGIFCGGEIGRGKLSMTGQESQEESPAERRYLHVYSTAYLVISYSAAPSE